jgi:hypothetical protein
VYKKGLGKVKMKHKAKKNPALAGFFHYVRFILCLLFLDPHLAADCPLMEELAGDRRLFKSGATAIFLQNAGTLVLLLKAPQSAVDWFVFLNDDTYQVSIPPFFLRFLTVFADSRPVTS